VKLIAVEYLEGQDPLVIVEGWLRLRVLRNFGAAFSFGSGATWVFSLVAIVVTIVVVRTARTLTSNWWAVALGALLGGALGNLIDRIVRAPGGGKGGVVDYFDVPWFSVFNLADVFLTFAAIGVAILALMGVPMSQPAEPASEPASGDAPARKDDGNGDILAE
jgi:signal peptidase II